MTAHILSMAVVVDVSSCDRNALWWRFVQWLVLGNAGKVL